MFEHYFSFFLACCALAILPGPDILYVLAQSMRHGWRLGFAIIFGLCTGLVVHTAIVAAGASALIAHYPVAFKIISLIGALYLLYLSYLILKETLHMSTGQGASLSDTPALSYGKAYRRGVLMNLSNPKVILFFLSFTQPFIVQGIPLVKQYIGLGLIFILSTLLVFGVVSVFSSFFMRLLTQSPKAQKVFNAVVACILFVLALYLLIAKVF